MKEDKRKSEETEETQVGTKKQQWDAIPVVDEERADVKTLAAGQDQKVSSRKALAPANKELTMSAKNGALTQREEKIKPDDNLASETETGGSVEASGAPEEDPGSATENCLLADTIKKEYASYGSRSVSEDDFSATSLTKKDKRKLEENEEMYVGAKKQKRNVIAVEEVKKSEIATLEIKQDHKIPTSSVLVLPEMELAVAAKSGHDLISEDETPEKVPGSATENAGAPEKISGTENENGLVAATKKKDSASNDTWCFSENHELAPTVHVIAAVPSTEDASAMITREEEENRHGEKSEETEPSNIHEIKNSTPVSEESSGDDDEASTDREAEDLSRNPEELPITPPTPTVQTSAAKTLFVGNLSFAVERDDVENFFKDAGELVDIRFAMNEDDSFRGFGYIEFATVEAAEKALRELNGKYLLHRRVRLDFTREKGSYTPYSGAGTSSNQNGVRAQGQTIFVKGFDIRDGEEKIKSALGDHFASCGEITRISIPKEYGGGFKGIAYIDFKEADAFNSALELDGSKCGEDILRVEGAKPRRDGHDSAWIGRNGGGIAGGSYGGRHGGVGEYNGHFGANGRGYGYNFGGGGHVSSDERGYVGHSGGGGRSGGDGRGYGGRSGGDGRGYGGRFGVDGHGYGDRSGGSGWGYGDRSGGNGHGYDGHSRGDGRRYGGQFESDGRGYGHFGGGGRGYGGRFGGTGRGYGSHFGGTGRGYNGNFGSGGRGYGHFGDGGRGW